MTTQTCIAFVGNKMMSRSYSLSATDGKFEGNNLVSVNANQQLGLEQTGINIDFLSMNYTGGGCLWRIQNSNTLKTERYGFASKAGYVCHSETKIPSYTIKSTDLLQVYPVAVNSTSGDTEVLGWVMTSRGVEPFGCTTSDNGVLTDTASLISGLSLGDYAFGSTLSKVCFQAEDGASLFSIAIIDATGGTVYQQTGNVRSPTAGSTNTQMNIEADLNIKIEKGWKLQVAVTS